MDRLDAMSVFMTVVEAGSFSEASRRVDMPITTVSRRVAELGPVETANGPTMRVVA